MFRTGLLTGKFCTVRMSSSCSLVQSSIKWLSTSASPSLKGNDQKLDESSSNEPNWIKTSLDKQIFLASDVQTLLLSIDNNKFDGRCAINVVNKLSQWVKEGKFTAMDFQKLDQRKRLEEKLLQGEFNIGVVGTLQALKSLQILGLSSNSKTVESVENEILWLLRKCTIGQHFLVIDLHSKMAESNMQNKIMEVVVSNIQRRWVELVDARDFVSLFKHSSHFNPKFLEKMEDVLVEVVENFTQEENIKIMAALASIKRRSTPLLRALSYHINKNTEKLPIRMASDLLYSLNRLSFHDSLLVERVCNDLVGQLTPDVKSSTVGSLLTSLGQLKYRHEGFLDALCDWVNHNWTTVRTQDILSLILCLAALDFLPSNWETLWEKTSQLLQEKKIQNSISKTGLLDLVWSLAILNHLDPILGRSVLNDDFIRDLLSPGLTNSKGAQLKLNQIWASAVLKKWDLSSIALHYYILNYNSLFRKINFTDLKISMPFPFDYPTLEKPKSSLNQAVINALINFIPSGKYLKVGSQTPLGIEVDAECIMNDKGVPLLFSDYEGGKPLPTNTARVAFIILNYNDLCKGKPYSIGSHGLRERLLTQSGYRVVKVHYTEFEPKDSLAKKVRNLESMIKVALSKSS